jgi:acetyl-CoA carboxylase biotin carboxylase subunit
MAPERRFRFVSAFAHAMLTYRTKPELEGVFRGSAPALNRSMFQKILIANRGEIAARIIRTCREMEIATVAVFSQADRTALHVRLADEAIAIGPAAAAESYLRIERILDAARVTRADAIHPGYGFLSENAVFAAACQTAGIKFIGPSVPSMELMGSKTRARRAMQAAGVPVVPGTHEPLADATEAHSFAEQIGYPVMLKAAAGGGGKGMRLVFTPQELRAALERAQQEALGAFGDGAVYLEKAIVRPRHVEVQILADEHGHTIHLGERECSLQRRHQKVLEESPSPWVEKRPEVRERLTAAAVRAAQAAGYTNAGTVEFLMDADHNFHFLEMNTRLQVEHPVTEMVTGLDLVREQILVAAGEPLRYQQSDIQPRGSAMECRIYAEDPDNSFFPSPGRISSLERPSGPHIRVDSGAYEGWTVPIEYDPLIAKLVAWGPTRDEAIARLQAALREYHVGGIKTTIGFFGSVLRNEDFRRGSFDTGFIADWLANRKPESAFMAEQEQAAILAAGAHFLRNGRSQEVGPRPAANAWKLLAKRAMLREP